MDRVAISNSRKREPELRVAEIFGPTIQGEGKHAGRVSHFVRLSGCNLACSWCDTPYTWDWKGVNGTAYDRNVESKVMKVSDIVNLLDSAMALNVVITGGEPLTQASGLVELIKDLNYLGISVEVETNGTREVPTDAPSSVQWNVSPKLPSSGNKRGIRPRVLATFPASAIFKFVVSTKADVDEIEALELPFEQVWLMPEGRTPKEVNAKALQVAEWAIASGYNFSHRLHVLLWGDKRGH
jgi:organic radical activating enzyme